MKNRRTQPRQRLTSGSATPALLLLALMIGCTHASAQNPAIQSPPPNGPGNALSFDGVDDYVSVPPSAVLNAYPLTISAWVKTSRNAPSFDGIVSKYTDASYNGYSVLLHNRHVRAFCFRDSANYVWDGGLGLDGGEIADDKWHHVALVVDSDGGRLLVDGVVAAFLPWTGTAGATTSSASLQLGRYWTVNNGLLGQMDEVQIWNATRTTEQIQADMRRQLFGNEPGLVAYWRFDEGSGTTAFDASGNANNSASLVNGPVWLPSDIVPFAPTVATLPVSSSTLSGAALNGSVNPNTATATGYFQWDAAGNFANTTTPQDLGSGNSAAGLTQLLTGLPQGETHYYRTVATNVHGASYGTALTFRPGFSTVTTLDDNVPGSLRQAVHELGAGGTVNFAANLLDNTIRLTSGEILITNSLTISGPGANRLSIQGTNSRVFHVASGQVNISGLDLRNGHASGAPGLDSIGATEDGGVGGDGEGGGILNYGDLTLTDCMVRSCRASGGWGGAGGPHFGILAPGTGGAGGAARGGGICNRGTLKLVRCTFANNNCIGGWGGTGGGDSHFGETPGGQGGAGGLAGGGALYNAGTLFATNCTIVTNTVLAGNGGIGGFGIPGGGLGGNGGYSLGAGFQDEGTAALVNCTLHANHGTAGSFGMGGAGSSLSGANGMEGTAAGGGMYSDGALPYTIVRNSLIAGNVAPAGTDMAGGFSSGGFNFIGTLNDGGAFVGAFDEPTDIVGNSPTILDPRFGTLAFHSGSTWTLALRPESPARDKGHASGTATDQRGSARLLDDPNIANVLGGDGSDIGAFESPAGMIFPVSTTAGTGPGSLHQAILDANARPGPDAIYFEIPGSGVRTLELTLALPAITDPVEIDGYTQFGASRGAPPQFADPVLLIELNCSQISGGECCAPCLQIQTSNCVVSGLVINRSPGPGIHFDDAHGNVIAGNFIGTDPTGSLALGNRTDGLLLQNSAHNLLGGTNDWSERNVISGNGSNGIHIVGPMSVNNIVNGNCIGTDLAGGTVLSNCLNGVVIEGGAFNRIGVPGASLFNTISGNSAHGVELRFASSNLVQANIIGLDCLSRVTALRNGWGDHGAGIGGVSLERATNNVIGGRIGADGNVISGNRAHGVWLSYSLGNVIGYNLIGLDGSGTTALENAGDGVHLSNSPSNTVGYAGGISDGAIISGNDDVGVYLESSPGVVICGNIIGTDANYELNLGNLEGVQVFDSDGVQLGTGPGQTGRGNVICNNRFCGVVFFSGRGSSILGNFIGTDPTGARPLGNRYGLCLYSENRVLTDLQIGGVKPATRNLIAFNQREGISCEGPLPNNPTNSIIRGNGIYSNGRLGIDLNAAGPEGVVTLNDTDDTDDGPNHFQNFPVLSPATNTDTGLIIAGTLNSHAHSTYTLDFYANPECDASGHGEGQWYVGATTVTTDGSGNAAFIRHFPPAHPGALWITATATDPNGNTSEFSACAQLNPGTSPSTLEVTSTADDGPGSLRWATEVVAPGGIVTFASHVTGTIDLTSTALVLDKDLTLQGPGAAVLAISGGMVHRVFSVNHGTVAITGLTIRDGWDCGLTAGTDGRGGGVFNGGSLTLSNCALIGNVACGASGTNGTAALNSRNGGAGGSGWGGGIYNTGQLSLIGSTLARNECRGGTGGNAASGGSGPLTGSGGDGGAAWGGAIYNAGTVLLLNCTFSENQSLGAVGGIGGTNSSAGGAGGAGGQGLGGAVLNDTALTVHNCSFVANVTSGGSGGAGGLGGEFDGLGGTGGNAAGGHLLNRGTHHLVNVTVAHGAATGGLGGPGLLDGSPGLAQGGGVFASVPSTFFLNTVVAHNSAASGGANVFGVVASLGHNLISTTNGSGGWVGSDLIGATALPQEPLLQPLTNYGGPTFTLVPLPGSPAFDAGDDAVLGSPWFLTTDQRGGLRQAGTHVDIGAVEVGGFLHITAISDAGSLFTINLRTEAGWWHHLESKDALAPDAPWTPVPDTSVLGSGGVMTLTEPRTPSTTNRYYRLVLTP